MQRPFTSNQVALSKGEAPLLNCGLEDGRTDQAEGPSGRSGGRRPLPCLSSNNSNEEGTAEAVQLTGGHRRMAYVLAFELKALVEKFGLEKCGFLTLTFGDKQSPCLRELQRRYNSLRTGVLSERYERGIFVVERGEKRGRLHLHGVVAVGRDIRTGLDFEALLRRDYRSANQAIRAEWAFWREAAPKYGFGRTELLPVKSTAEGIARYVGSYIKKHLLHREDRDKGARVVRFMNYGPGDRKASTRLAWNSERAWLWRAKVRGWASVFGMHSMDELTAVCGPRWAYVFKDQILGTRLAEGIVYPSLGCAVGSVDQVNYYEQTRLNALRRAEAGRPAVRTMLIREAKDCEFRPF